MLVTTQAVKFGKFPKFFGVINAFEGYCIIF